MVVGILVMTMLVYGDGDGDELNREVYDHAGNPELLKTELELAAEMAKLEQMTAGSNDDAQPETVEKQPSKKKDD